MINYRNVALRFQGVIPSDKSSNVVQAQWSKKVRRLVASYLKKNSGKKADRNEIDNQLSIDPVSGLAKIEHHAGIDEKLKEIIAESRKKIQSFAVTSPGANIDKVRQQIFTDFGINDNEQKEEEYRKKEALRQFLQMTRQDKLGILLYDDTYSMPISEGLIIQDDEKSLSKPILDMRSRDEHIAETFININKSLEYFSTSYYRTSEFRQLVDIAMYSIIADDKDYQIGLDPELLLKQSVDRAYSVKVLFGDFKQCSQFRKKFSNHKSLSAVVPTSINIPHKNDLGGEMVLWQNLIMQGGQVVIDNLRFAEQIRLQNSGNIPKNKQEFQESIRKVRYYNYDKEQEFGRICSEYGVAEQRFNRMLTITGGRVDPEDVIMVDDKGGLMVEENALPDITVDVGEECKFPSDTISAKAKDMIFMKLPKGDKRGLILGDISKSCQSVGAPAENCAIDGTKFANNGFYVLLKMKKSKKIKPQDIEWRNLERQAQIVGQGYVWRGKLGGIVFDSWENLMPNAHDELMPEILGEFAKKAMQADPTITRVAIGTGGKTPAIFKDETRYFISGRIHDRKIYDSELMLQGRPYGDSVQQSEILSSPDLQMTRQYGLMDLQKRKYYAAILTTIPEAEQVANADKELFSRVKQPKDLDLVAVMVAQYPDDLTKKYLKQKLEMLSSPNISHICTLANGPRFEQLASMPAYQLKEVTSDHAIELLKLEICHFDDIAGFDADKIEALAQGRWGDVKKYGVDFEMVKGLDHLRVAVMVGDKDADDDYDPFDAIDPIPLFEGKFCPIDLVQIEPTLFMEYGTKTLLKLIQKEKYGFSVRLLKDTPASKMKILLKMFSSIPCDLGEANAPKTILRKLQIPAGDLLDLDEFTMGVLTTPRAAYAYKNGVDFYELKKLDGEVAARIINYHSVQTEYLEKTTYLSGFKLGYFKVEDFQALDKDSFCALTGLNACNLYKKNITNFNYLKSFNAETIEALCSKNSFETMQLAGISIEDLGKLGSATRIKKLTSESVQALYKSGISFSDLKVLSPGQLEKVTSKEMLPLYQFGISVHDVVTMEKGQLEIIKTQDVIGALKAGMHINEITDLVRSKPQIEKRPALQVRVNEIGKILQSSSVMDKDSKEEILIKPDIIKARVDRGLTIENIASIESAKRSFRKKAKTRPSIAKENKQILRD